MKGMDGVRFQPPQAAGVLDLGLDLDLHLDFGVTYFSNSFFST